MPVYARSSNAPASVAGATAREEGGLTIHSVQGVDIVSTDPKKPGQYTCLCDFPEWGYKKGQVNFLSSADPDEAPDHFAATMKEIVAAPSLAKQAKKAAKAKAEEEARKQKAAVKA